MAVGSSRCAGLRKRTLDSHHVEPPPRESLSPALIELAYLGSVLIVYIAGLEFSRRLPGDPAWGTWLRLLGLNAWLLAATLLWLARHPLGTVSVTGVRHGRPLAAIIGVMTIAVFVAAVALPSRPDARPCPFAEAMALILLVPVAEELYFRALLLDHLTRNLGRASAVVLASVLFGFLHWPQGMAGAMVILSLVLCMVVLSSGGVIWAVALHVVWNAFAVLRQMSAGSPRWIAAGVAVVVLLALGWTGFRAGSRSYDG